LSKHFEPHIPLLGETILVHLQKLRLDLRHILTYRVENSAITTETDQQFKSYHVFLTPSVLLAPKTNHHESLNIARSWLK